jgi:hypothetical protein
MCAGVPTIEMKIFHGLLGIPQHKALLHTNNGFPKKKETISAVIEEKQLREVLRST